MLTKDTLDDDSFQLLICDIMKKKHRIKNHSNVNPSLACVPLAIDRFALGLIKATVCFKLKTV